MKPETSSKERSSEFVLDGSSGYPARLPEYPYNSSSRWSKTPIACLVELLYREPKPVRMPEPPVGGALAKRINTILAEGNRFSIRNVLIEPVDAKHHSEMQAFGKSWMESLWGEVGSDSRQEDYADKNSIIFEIPDLTPLMQMPINGEKMSNEKKEEFDLDAAIPGLAEGAVAEGGVDAAVDDEGCEGGACKI